MGALFISLSEPTSLPYDVAIVGGGCVGCSAVKHLAERSGLDICVLETEHHLERHLSGRNSGVLHPGFNYRPDSLRARFATEGTARLKAYARETEIPLKEFGVVVVVAQDETEAARLDDLEAQAEENGVDAEIIGPDSLHVLNLVSPGLTSALSFGDFLTDRVLADIDG